MKVLFFGGLLTDMHLTEVTVPLELLSTQPHMLADTKKLCVVRRYYRVKPQF